MRTYNGPYFVFSSWGKLKAHTERRVKAWCKANNCRYVSFYDKGRHSWQWWVQKDNEGFPWDRDVTTKFYRDFPELT